MKRLFDIAVSIAALIVLSPVLAAVALLVRVSMGAPVLFRQDRGGLSGSVFEIYKFRTMLDGPGEDHERLTKLGRILRSTSLDELPELFNVLKGDMSLVGPRPFHAEYLSSYSERQSHRHDVRPGITGLAQIRGRNSISWERRFELDLDYVNRASMRMDLWILLETVRTVVRRKGIASDDSVTMTRFRGGAGDECEASSLETDGDSTCLASASSYLVKQAK